MQVKTFRFQKIQLQTIELGNSPSIGQEKKISLIVLLPREKLLGLGTAPERKQKRFDFEKFDSEPSSWVIPHS